MSGGGKKVGVSRLGPSAGAEAGAEALGPSRMPPTTPGKFETDGESQKKNISQEKKISPKTKISSNGNTNILIINVFFKAPPQNSLPMRAINNASTALVVCTACVV